MANYSAIYFFCVIVAVCLGMLSWWNVNFLSRLTLRLNSLLQYVHVHLSIYIYFSEVLFLSTVCREADPYPDAPTTMLHYGCTVMFLGSYMQLFLLQKRHYYYMVLPKYINPIEFWCAHDLLMNISVLFVYSFTSAVGTELILHCLSLSFWVTACCEILHGTSCPGTITFSSMNTCLLLKHIPVLRRLSQFFPHSSIV